MPKTKTAMPKTKTAMPETETAAKDIIKQWEVEAFFHLDSLRAVIDTSFRRRADAGATIEPGPYVLDREESRDDLPQISLKGILESYDRDDPTLHLGSFTVRFETDPDWWPGGKSLLQNLADLEEAHKKLHDHRRKKKKRT